MAKKASKKKEAPATFEAGNAPHRVYKKGKDVVVDHLGKKGGKNDKINLTKRAGVKSVKEGVQASKSWHKNRSHGRGR